MRITRLTIEDLYEDTISYDIDFNDNLTILYGDNGAGKTTVLELLTIIISGNIINLFKYDFKSIVLTYKENELAEKRLIVSYKNESKLEVNFMDKTSYIEEDYMKDMFSNKLSEYKFLKNDIKDTFNMVFLPLTRNNKTKKFSDNSNKEKRYFEEIINIRSNEMKVKPSKNNDPIRIVEEIIEKKTSRMMYEVEKLNLEFKNNIFKGLFVFDFDGNPFYKSTKKEDFEERKEKLLKVVKDIGLESTQDMDDMKNIISNLYSEFKKVETKSFPSKKRQKKDEIDMESLKLLISNSSRLKILDEVILLAEENNKKKEQVIFPISKFEKTINSYFSGGTFSKKIFIEKGEIFFCMDGSSKRLKINKLSSGEQQLVIFFVHLIFGLSDNEEGIYIVDEPEISLHLSWQRKLIDSIMDINNNLQLIFATHSPEIIGPHRKNTFELKNTKVLGGE